jgi:nucleoside-diphosphate-sugar epimerase
MTTQSLPAVINTVAELDELLSRPYDALIQSVKALDGDIMILGAGGKVGPTIAMMARRAVDAASVKKSVYAVDLFPMPKLEARGIDTVTCDMMDLDAVAKLPQVENIVYMIGRKFGSTGQEHLTWSTNVIVPYHAARAFTGSRIVAFSTGCVYPLLHFSTGGATEETPAEPVGEYAQSCLGRERMFDYFAEEKGEKVLHFRLNYAIDLRYGVLWDVASKVWKSEPVDITTNYANVIWQGDVSNTVLQCFTLANSPAAILNVTGPETFKISDAAEKFAKLMGKPVQLKGEENGIAYLSNASKMVELFGKPKVSLDTMIEWIARWVMQDGENLGKPTHFETQNGKY